MRYNRLREITIKKTVILLIVNLILWLNTAKTGLLECYDQETCSFIDRNPDRELYPETALTRHSSIAQVTTAGVYALPAVQSKLRELHQRLAPPALCHGVQIMVSRSRWPFTDPKSMAVKVLAFSDLQIIDAPLSGNRLSVIS